MMHLSETETLLEQRRALDAAAIVSEADLQGNITFVNEQFVKISGYTRDELIGQNHRILNSGTHSPLFFSHMWQTISSGAVWQGEICNQTKDGQCYWVKSTIVPVLDPHTGRPLRYQSIRFDITNEKALEAALKKQAHHDALTGLSNRNGLSEQFDCAKKIADRRHSVIAVCLMDLDHFKAVNDQYGHATGDALLKEVSNRLIQALRLCDTVARLGGDEFVLLLTELNTSQEAIHALNRVKDALAVPCSIAGTDISIGASYGVALYSDSHNTLDALLRDADQALYEAKHQGRNQFLLFNSALQTQRDKAHQLVESVQAAFEQQQLALFYQPKVNMRSGKIIGMEALLRWIDPEQGIVPPLSFLPHIEQTPLIIAIGNWAIETALQQLRQWRSQGLDWVISVNIAAFHLQHSQFLSELKAILARYPDVPAQGLSFEILESVALTDINNISQLIRDCQALGIQFDLDDFGTGYSSLSYLKKLPAETIKIDQSFVRDLLDDDSDRAIIEAIISIGKAFKRHILAEGVETDEQGALLLRLGCDLAQGYGIAKPMPAEQVVPWADQFSASPLWQQWQAAEWDLIDIPLITAQRDHMLWVARIQHLINHPEKLADTHVEDHHHCRFGRWYDGAGKRYQHLVAYQAIETHHVQLHEVAQEIIQLLRQGDSETAQQRFSLLSEHKDQVVRLLTELQTSLFTHSATLRN